MVHALDALVIVASFVLDVLLGGMLEQAASLVVLVRLWRVVEIVDELSSAGEAQGEMLSDRIGELEGENVGLLARIQALEGKMQQRTDEQGKLVDVE